MGIPSLFHNCFVFTGLMPPQSSVAPMGCNATFQCIAANGLIIWSVNNIQVSSPSLQQFFATHGIFIPLERRNNSTVMILATPMNNGTRLTCLVGEFAVVCRSDPVTLIVYGQFLSQVMTHDHVYIVSLCYSYGHG